MAVLIARDAMEPVPAAASDPVHIVIAEHCAALVAMTAAQDDETAVPLIWLERAAREKLMPFVPTTLAGLQAKLAYTLAFSLPAWADSDPEDEPIDLLRSTSEALTRLLG